VAVSSGSPRTPRSLVRKHPGMRKAITHLEHVKRLKLDIFTLIPQQIHHHLQVRLVGNVPCHDIEISSI